MTDSAPHTILIAFGANLGDREETARKAQHAIQQRIGPLRKISSLMENPPLVLAGESPDAYPWFLNAVWQGVTALSPDACLEQLLTIETLMGRVRDRRWGPRVIDLDLLSYDSLVYHTPGLTIPHAEMHLRSFVLKPLCEIQPDWMHPVLGKSARALLEALPEEEEQGRRTEPPG